MLLRFSPPQPPMCSSWQQATAGGAATLGPGRSCTSCSWTFLQWQPHRRSLLLVLLLPPPPPVPIPRLHVQYGRRIWMCRWQSSDTDSLSPIFTEESQEEVEATDISAGSLDPLVAETEEHGNLPMDMVENFPDLAGTNSDRSDDTLSRRSSYPSDSISARRDRAMARAFRLDEKGHLSPQVSYLLDLGMDIESIEKMVRRYPSFTYISLDRKIKPLVELLLDLGVPKKNIQKIIRTSPQLCGISLTKNLKPTMLYLESFGLDKAHWAKVITRSPVLLANSRQKMKLFIDFLLELGVQEKNVGKILTLCPNILSCSVEEKLRPVSEYFFSLGVDVPSLIEKYPQNFGLSIEDKLKPATVFFEERGFSIEEIAVMVNKCGSLFMYSLEDNLVPKWEYFLTMGYPRSALIKLPQYFGYSLEGRIKPRFNRVRACGVNLSFSRLLTISNSKFDDMLEKEMKKLVRLSK